MNISTGGRSFHGHGEGRESGEARISPAFGLSLKPSEFAGAGDDPDRSSGRGTHIHAVRAVDAGPVFMNRSWPGITRCSEADLRPAGSEPHDARKERATFYATCWRRYGGPVAARDHTLSNTAGGSD